jgi:superfamily II helicase
MKVCSKCKKEKSLNDFSINRDNVDGKSGICKQCINEKVRKEYHEKKNNPLKAF